MLKDYFWSLTLVALVLLVYTALVFSEKRVPDARMENGRSAASLKIKTDIAPEVNSGVNPSAVNAHVRATD